MSHFFHGSIFPLYVQIKLLLQFSPSDQSTRKEKGKALFDNMSNNATLLLYPFPVLSMTLDLTTCVFGVNDIL
jgi:hypothetical protein